MEFKFKLGRWTMNNEISIYKQIQMNKQLIYQVGIRSTDKSRGRRGITGQGKCPMSCFYVRFGLCDKVVSEQRFISVKAMIHADQRQETKIKGTLKFKTGD